MADRIIAAGDAESPYLAWLQRRQRGLGSSDTPVLLLGTVYGRTPVDLYLDKVTPLCAPPADDNPAFRRGRTYEPLALALWAAAHPTAQVFRPADPRDRYRRFCWQHPAVPWLFADLDGICVEDGSAWVLEVKCPGQHALRRLRQEGLPPYYRAQAQHLALVAGACVAHGQRAGQPPGPIFELRTAPVAGVRLIVFDSEAVELLPADLPPDPALQAEIAGRAERFWRDHVTPRVPPLTSPQPVDLPAAPAGDRSYAPLAGATWEGLTAQWAAARTAASAAQERADRWDEILTQALEAAHLDRARLPDGTRISWALEAGRRTLDRKALERAHPEIPWDQFTKRGAPHRTLRVAPAGAAKEGDPHD